MLLFYLYRYKDTDPVQPSVTVLIVNEGTELRISQIKNEDIGDYTCIARNGEGKIHHVVKVLIAGESFGSFVFLSNLWNNMLIQVMKC